MPGSLVGSDCLLSEKGSDVRHTSNVKVLRGPLTFGGWKAKLTLDGDLMTMEDAASRRFRARRVRQPRVYWS
ncbi:hypothetical protein [Kribbella sp. CCNWLY201]|uniref:hypothetical protein n=1 Tax=Kribbella sp. CCNWLY201 TaxID=3128544 RepID=UPI0030196322